jgi:GT2 family glycosyltransferase
MITGAGPRVSIIVLTYNGRHLLKECLDSILDQTYRNAEVIVVDNGSSDGSPEFLKAQYGGRAKLILHHENLGFAEGNNLGIAAAGGEFVALLNNDAVADSRWLEELMTAVSGSGPEVGMWASKILFHDNRDVIDTAGHLIYRDGLNRGRGKNEPDNGQYDRQEEVFFPSGCAALYAKKMLAVVGGFDPDFFAYGDDTDLGIKARLAGWTCLYVPTAVVFHRSSATAGAYSQLKAYLVERNRIWVLIKYFPPRDIFFSVFYTIVRYVFQAYGALTGRGAAGRFVEGSSRSGLLRVLFKAYYDAIQKLPLMLKKRKAFRPLKKASSEDFHAWLRNFKIRASEISLKD